MADDGFSLVLSRYEADLKQSEIRLAYSLKLLINFY